MKFHHAKFQSTNTIYVPYCTLTTVINTIYCKILSNKIAGMVSLAH